jgi:glycolate dehydrogenase FAD-linked subunit
MGYIEELKAIVGEKNVHTGEIDCIGFSRDMSVHQGIPEVIAFARTADEVSRVVKVAAAHKIPVVPRGAGTSGPFCRPRGGFS